MFVVGSVAAAAAAAVTVAVVIGVVDVVDDGCSCCVSSSGVDVVVTGVDTQPISDGVGAVVGVIVDGAMVLGAVDTFSVLNSLIDNRPYFLTFDTVTL